MDYLKMQVILFWVAVTLFVVATIIILISMIFKKYNLMKLTPFLALAGYIPQTAGIILRWIETGHFPYWGKYETYNGYAWGAMTLYLLVVLIKPKLKIIGTLVFPFAFFMIGIGLTHTKEIKELPISYLNYWLGVHIAFAKLAFTSGLISAFFGVVYLWKSRKQEKESVGPAWFPSLESAEYYSYRCAVFAFITLSIMIGAGSVWAFKAWGNYWSWDPVETWSLVCWFIYGIVLHLRVTMRWRGTKAAWLSIFALAIIFFAYFGMPLIYDTVHEHLSF